MLITGFKTQRYDFRKSKRTIFKLAYNVMGLCAVALVETLNIALTLWGNCI